MTRRLLLGLLLVWPTTALAQVCVGGSDDPVQLRPAFNVSAAHYAGEGSLTVIGATRFWSVGVVQQHARRIAVNITAATGRLGLERRYGSVRVCPLVEGSAARYVGPWMASESLQQWAAGGGLFVAYARRVAPFIGLRYLQAGYSGSAVETHDIRGLGFGLLTAGVGLPLHDRIRVSPWAEWELWIDGGDPAMGVAVTLALGR